MVDLSDGSLTHVASVECGFGYGLAVCAPMGVLFTCCAKDGTISGYELKAPAFRKLGTWGGPGDGPLQFRFPKLANGYPFAGMMCLAGVPSSLGGGSIAGAASAGCAAVDFSLLVADTGNDRVVEVGVGAVVSGDRLTGRVEGVADIDLTIGAAA